MILTINNIIASDLQQIQRVGRLNPYIVLSCGHSTFQTKKVYLILFFNKIKLFINIYYIYYIYIISVRKL